MINSKEKAERIETSKEKITYLPIYLPTYRPTSITMPIHTPLTTLLGIQHPVILAGMNAVSHSDLVAAVSNAGGLGVLGGLTMTPKMLRQEIHDVKAALTERDPKKMKFGVDLALPKVGGSARKTNYDYTHGHLAELIDITIEEGASLFVSAVGIPPRWVVEKLHAAGIPVMNMCGHPKHALKAVEVGCDIVCAQGTEGGGHTGDIATSVLLPLVVDAVRGRKSSLHGGPISVVGAGGIFDGRGLAAALAYGADAVWVGTRFICAEEAASPPRHTKGVLTAPPDGTMRTLIYSGRPLRVRKMAYIEDWENNRAEESQKLRDEGILPYANDMEQARKQGKTLNLKDTMPMLMGQAAGAVDAVEPAAKIVSDMVTDAERIMRASNRMCKL
eukprot:g3223.t1